MELPDNRIAKNCRYYNRKCPDDAICPIGAYCHKANNHLVEW